MLILIIFAMNTKKPQGSYVNFFTINWLNLEEPLGEAVVRIRNLADEAWNYNSHWSRLVILLSILKTLLINKDSKSPTLVGPFFGKPKYTISTLSCQSFYVEKIWCYFHLKWEMEIWKWRGVGILSQCSLPLFCVIHYSRGVKLLLPGTTSALQLPSKGQM